MYRQRIPYTRLDDEVHALCIIIFSRHIFLQKVHLSDEIFREKKSTLIRSFFKEGEEVYSQFGDFGMSKLISLKSAEMFGKQPITMPTGYLVCEMGTKKECRRSKALRTFDA